MCNSRMKKNCHINRIISMWQFFFLTSLLLPYLFHWNEFHRKSQESDVLISNTFFSFFCSLYICWWISVHKSVDKDFMSPCVHKRCKKKKEFSHGEFGMNFHSIIRFSRWASIKWATAAQKKMIILVEKTSLNGNARKKGTMVINN